MSKNKNPFSDEGWEKITDKIKKEKEGDKKKEEETKTLPQETKELNDYDKDIHIDIDQLEIEWLRQPHLYKKYSKLAVDAEFEVDSAKEAIDLSKQKLEKTKASVDNTIRVERQLSGEKVTDKIIEALVVLDATYQEDLLLLNKRKHEYIKRKHEYNSFSEVAVKSVEQRKSALENLVKLGLGEYFAAPQQPRSIENIKETALESLDEKVRSQINKKRRKRNGEKK